MHFSGSRALLRKAWGLQYGIKPQPRFIRRERSDSSTAQRTPASSHNQATSRAFPSTFPKVSQPLRRTITKPSSSGKLQTKCRCALPNYFWGETQWLPCRPCPATPSNQPILLCTGSPLETILLCLPTEAP